MLQEYIDQSLNIDSSYMQVITAGTKLDMLKLLCIFRHWYTASFSMQRIALSPFTNSNSLVSMNLTDSAMQPFWF